MALYLSEQKLLFVHIPKTGGTSITNWISSNLQYAKYAKPKHGTPKIYTSFRYKQYFTVVRNPYARLLSWYTYHCPHEVTFLKFNNWLLNTEKTPNLRNAIWWTQKSYVETGNPIILRTETLKEDFKQIQDIVNVHKELPHNNSSFKINYKNFYNNSSKQIVEELFGEDLEYFDYTF